MNIRIFTAMLLTAMSASAMAQETYENATIADKDLKGTARYVGMGGAMEALGSDISTISTNPAGIGTFRSSQITMSGGLQINNGNTACVDGSKLHGSFDQVGVVMSMKEGYGSFLNIAFNYHKSKDFNQILNAVNTLNGASQNKLSYLKGYLGVFASDDINYSQVDAAYYDRFLLRDDGRYYYEDANSYDFTRVSRGYIGNYDFNISGNINNTVYLGATFGIKDVHYNGTSLYNEQLSIENDYAQLNDYREITGHGYDLKLGVIVRPFQYSGFRLGAYAQTPTFYKLTTANETRLQREILSNTQSGAYEETYKYCINTPWTFGLSAGHTIGTKVALGLTYEYCDYAHLDTRIYDGQNYDYGTSYSDNVMNANTKASLQGVHTLKAGVEYRPTSELSLRCGYNFVSPKYKESGYKDGSLESYGSYYASQTDYTNWQSTNRYTLGVGYSKDQFFVDLAYQYSQRNGKFCPFMSYYDDDPTSDLNNICAKTDVSEKRHNILLTLGYKF